MQLADLIKSFKDMNPQELQEKIREIRKNKYELKPAVQARTKKAKEGVLSKALSKLTPEQLAALKKQYGVDDA